VLFLISTAVKLSSPGPVFFRQERVGFKGKSFFIYGSSEKELLI
jgi:lipopolysaccharide/colanic/teichoic acid biosynthesis glycosyltransferase